MVKKDASKKISKKNIIKNSLPKKTIAKKDSKNNISININNNPSNVNKAENNVIIKENVIHHVDDKKAFLIIGASIILLLIFFYFLFVYSPYKYSFVVNDVSFNSNYYTPNSFFNIIKNEKTVYVSPALQENNISPIMVNSMQLWNIVLNYNKINVIQLIRVYEDGELKYCQTNNGALEVSDMVNSEECNAIINDSNWIILINEGKPSVIIEKNKVIVSSRVDDSSLINFMVIKSIFPNAQEILDLVNQKIYGVK